MKIQYIVAPHAAKYHGRQNLGLGRECAVAHPVWTWRWGRQSSVFMAVLNPPSLNHRRRDHHGRHRHHQGYDLWGQVRAWLRIATRFSGPVS
jgi:hypothetical protein